MLMRPSSTRSHVAWVSSKKLSRTITTYHTNWPSRMPTTRACWRQCSHYKPSWRRRTAGPSRLGLRPPSSD